MIFEIELSRTAEHLFKLTKKKYSKVAKFSRFNASIKSPHFSIMKIYGYMQRKNNEYNLHLTITVEKGGAIHLG